MVDAALCDVDAALCDKEVVRMLNDRPSSRLAADDCSPETLPLYRNGFHSGPYLAAVWATETAIYETYLFTDRQLTDHVVKQALSGLMQQLRLGSVRQAAPGLCETPLEDLLVCRIRSNWDRMAGPRCSDDEWCDILRCVRRSVETWSRPAPDSRGYLKFLEGFLSDSDLNLAECSDEQILRELGVAWLESRDPMAKKEFLAIAHDLLDEGQAGVVIEVCQHLIGRTNSRDLLQELADLFDAAWDQEPPIPVHRPRRRRPPGDPIGAS
jgi:hypothetical protein